MYIVYGTPNCKYCTMSKTLLEMNKIDYKYKEVGSDVTKEQLEEMVGHPVKTVPQIFKMSGGFGEYIGGFDELRASLK